MELSEEEAEIPLPINSSFVGVHVHAHHGHIQHGHITHHPHHHHHNTSSSHNQHNNIVPPLNNSNGGTSSTITRANATIMEEDHHYHRNNQGEINDHNSNGNNHDDDDYDHDDLGSKLKKTMIIRYKECQKNHAASMGGKSTDGCGEFMPSGEEGTLESLTCSACNCHRNFHRKEIQGEHHHHTIPPLSTTHSHFYPSTPHTHLLDARGRNVISGSVRYPTDNVGPLVPFSRSVTINMPPTYTLSDQFDHHHGYHNGGGMMNMMVRPRNNPPEPNQVVKKRFRTKFSQEQKEKMLAFAEKVGWKIQKQDESVVQQFCQEVGVKRRVLKVWMHNNKHNLAKKNDNIIDNNIINHSP